MYGNIVTNKQLKILLESHLSIRPFEESHLKEAAYTLNPGKILKRNDEGDFDVAKTLTPKSPKYALQPDEYVVVEAKQTVVIQKEGLIGLFITASTNIENGLMVLAGQIDNKYGTNGEALRFGVKNLLPVANEISLYTRLVHMQIIDLRGSAADPVRISPAAGKVLKTRTPDSRWADEEWPGPRYDLESDEEA